MSHPDDCLPDCMMPDGVEACAGYQHARAEIAELSNQIVELRGWLENRRTGHEQALDLLDKAIRRRERAESEIAQLTEQRDRAMKAVEAARVVQTLRYTESDTLDQFAALDALDVELAAFDAEAAAEPEGKNNKRPEMGTRMGRAFPLPPLRRL